MKLGIKMLNHNKDNIEFVTEIPCFLGHPEAKGAIFKPGLVIVMKQDSNLFYSNISLQDPKHRGIGVNI